MTNFTSRALLAVVFLGGARMLACTESSTPSDEVISTPGAPAPQGATPETPSAPTPSAGGCEDLGSLSATSLSATYDDRDSIQFTTFGVANRSLVTKVKLLAVGDAATLVGKPAVLGAGANVNLSSCTHCVLVALGCGATCENAAWFFARSGTATFTSIASANGDRFAGSFQDVELERVSIDAATMTSTPIPTGACMRVKSLVFDAKTAASGGELDSGRLISDDAGSDGGEVGGSGGGGSKGHVLL